MYNISALEVLRWCAI